MLAYSSSVGSRALPDAAAATAPQHACVGRHLATRNDMRVSGSRQLRVAILVKFYLGLHFTQPVGLKRPAQFDITKIRQRQERVIHKLSVLTYKALHTGQPCYLADRICRR